MLKAQDATRRRSFYARVKFFFGFILLALMVASAPVDTADAGRRGGGLIIGGGGIGIILNNRGGWRGGYERRRSYQRYDQGYDYYPERRYRSKRRVTSKSSKKNQVSTSKGYKARTAKSRYAKSGKAAAATSTAVATAADVENDPADAKSDAPVESGAPDYAPSSIASTEAAGSTNSLSAPDKSVGEPATAISTPGEIASAQVHLKFMGYDIPEANGAMNLKTKIAIMQFQETIGAEPSGLLTLEQMQTLFDKVAEKSGQASVKR